MTDTTERLTEVEVAVLRVLDEQRRSQIRDVLWQVPTGIFGWRGLSFKCRAQLLLLQRADLVAPFDNKKPIAWVRTPAGTAALARRGRVES